MDFGGRKEIFKALCGSHNYNLNTLESDKDYKVFVAPTFEDLYFNKQYSNSIIGATEDLDIHDIRKVSNLWWKANVNFLEVLFSEEFLINEVRSRSKTTFLLMEIYKMRDEIAKMNLPYLYDACIGMYHNKVKYLTKGTEGTQHLVDKYGYDTKQFLHAFRILDFLERFKNTGFNNFKKAIWYEDNEDEKRILLDMKNGSHNLEMAKRVLESKLMLTEISCREIYKSQKSNEKTNEELISLVKEIVKINL